MTRLVLIVLLLAPGPLSQGENGPPATVGFVEPRPVGSSTCAVCHLESHATWKHSRHSKMMQPATAESVQGDFAGQDIELHGESYTLFVSEGGFYITESYLSPTPRERRVDYTLGNRRVQHYLTTLESGQIVILPPSWDILRQEWFHNMEIVGPEQGTGLPLRLHNGTPIQVWNKDCIGCHVSGARKEFSQKTGRYASTWREFGTSCERCHGPGSRHVDLHFRQPTDTGEEASGSTTLPGDIINPARLDQAAGSSICASCHSLRAEIASGFTPGADFYDHFLPLLEYRQRPSRDPAWWPDGRPRRFSSNALGIWQSRCFLEGNLSCMTCHTATHEPEIEANPQLAPGNSSLCTGCHAGLAANLESHTHHDAGSEASACVACHMPYTTVGIKARMRDHTISIPVPENTSRFGIDNACTACHTGRSPEWATAALHRWYPDSASREELVHRAEAFSMARSGRPEAINALLPLATSAGGGPLVRANAVGWLGRFTDPRALSGLRRALQDEAPLVRAIAALEMSRAGRQDPSSVQDDLAGALRDKSRAVRSSAAHSLLNLGVNVPAGEARGHFERAKEELMARADLQPDSAAMQFDLGKVHFLNRQPEAAAAAFETALLLDPRLPRVRYSLAVVRLSQGRRQEAVQLLRQVTDSDPLFGPSRRLLARVEPGS